MSDGKVLLHPTTVRAINAEVANYQARQEDYELAIEFMRECAEKALEDCMLANSVQAKRLRMAIERADHVRKLWGDK